MEILKKTALEKGIGASHEFYHACLDRLDMLITEKNSTVSKDETVKILRVLAYFRPREYETQENKRKNSGIFNKSEMQDDLISVKHKKLI